MDEERNRSLPSVYSLGTEYRFKEQLCWSFQADYDPTSTYRIATGLEWQAIQFMAVKIGCYYQQQWVGCLGFAFQWDRLLLDTNIDFHPLLGVLCQARVAYHLPSANAR